MRAWYLKNRTRAIASSRTSYQRRKATIRDNQREERLRLQGTAKHRARKAAANAVRDGRLTRQPCEVCGRTETVEAHHDDYTKPLDVRWLCRPHHRELHRIPEDLRSVA